MLTFTGWRAPQLSKPTATALVVLLAVGVGILGAVLAGAVNG